MPKHNEENSLTPGLGNVQRRRIPDEREQDEEQEMESSSMASRIERMEKEIERLKKHQHLGEDEDGSSVFEGNTEMRAKEMEITGGGQDVGDFILVPFIISEGDEGDIAGRIAGQGIYVLGSKQKAGEQIGQSWSVGKRFQKEGIVPGNKTDFSKINFAQMHLIQLPQGSATPSGPSNFPPLSFLRASRTPNIIGSTGTITKGGNTFTDSTASFTVDSLKNCILSILNSAGTPIETHIISSNTENVVTIDGTWESDSGSYGYQAQALLLLGSADTPFARVYVGNDIRLGYGTSGGTSVQYIKWGTGSPEGVVTANRGSLFLRIDGGAGTCFYVKESGTGNTGWVAK